MNFENVNANLEKESKGENVIVHSVFIRHGEKFHDINNPETELTPKGREASREIGKNRPEVDAIKGYSSDTQRTQTMIQIMNLPRNCKG
ncbi:MAG: histidine phosphatase family protein [Patescibacteria group bacterium]|jgi:broad specificity phosphatase PhoE